MFKKYDHSDEGLNSRFLFSGIIKRQDPDAKELSDYIVNFARNPDPDSEFAKKSGDLSNVPSQTILAGLQSQNYEALIFNRCHNVLGYVAFQEKTDGYDKSWNIFRIFVEEDIRRQGYGTHFVREIIHNAYRRQISKVKVGDGGNKAVDRIVDILAAEMIRSLDEKIENLGKHADLSTRIFSW